MDDEFYELQRAAMKACEAYYKAWKELRGRSAPFVWLENTQTGELMIYTPGDAVNMLKEAIDGLGRA